LCAHIQDIAPRWQRSTVESFQHVIVPKRPLQTVLNFFAD
jgi:hypothetical protein